MILTRQNLGARGPGPGPMGPGPYGPGPYGPGPIWVSGPFGLHSRGHKILIFLNIENIEMKKKMCTHVYNFQIF